MYHINIFRDYTIKRHFKKNDSSSNESSSYSLLYLFKHSSIQKKLYNGKRKSLSRIFCRALRSFRSNTEENREGKVV